MLTPTPPVAEQSSFAASSILRLSPMVALFSLSLRSPPRAAASLRPRAAAAPAPAAARELRLPYDLREGQARVFHRLPSGLAMEAIVQRGVAGGGGAAGEERRPPLVFVHGSFHAAWCWAEHWMPYFSSHGYDCYALSLLGQGESDVTQEKVAGTLQTHTRDIYNFIHEEVKLPPVLIGHSFGGTIVQSYIAAAQPSNAVGYERKLAGAILLCSTPPSGNAGLVLRYLFTRPIDAIKVTRSLAAKQFATSLPLCKETFFSSTMDDQLVKRYQELIRESSRLPLFDLRKLNASLPVPLVPKGSVPLLVLGARNDLIVDMKGVEETACFYHVDPVILDGVAHDAMLDPSWEKGAEVILSWLESLSRKAGD